MSFSGGPGHKSPFAERTKSTKSHLSPRRSSTASNSNPRPAQQSLFGKESTLYGDSSAKVAQFRSAQSEVKEPTTPTRLSEGGAQKGNRRDEFSSFNSRRIGTPIKTPRTAFGSIPPRSPKRPYVGSPKYQKVLLERPAFYNTPGEPAVEPERKEITISELQKRLKRFLQDENGSTTLQVAAATDNLEDVPYNISRSPRVNPLFHHDETVMQVAKGGVAFTAGVTDTTSMHTRPGGVAFTAGAEDVMCSHTRPVCLFKEETSTPQSGTSTAPPDAQDEPASSVDAADEPASGTDTTSPDAQDEPASSIDAQNEPASGTDTASPDAQDEPASSIDAASPNAQCGSHDEGLDEQELEQSLHSEDFPVHTEVEDGSQVEEGASEDVDPALESEEKSVASLTSPIVEVQEPEGAIETLDSYEEEEIEVILVSWTQRFLKFVVLAVLVTCVMGMMVLASGSQGLLPHSLHSQPRLFRSSPLIPVSIGFMGHGKAHEGLQCLPAVHFRSKNPPSTSSDGAIPEPITVARMDSEVAGTDNDELKSVIDYYKELQGKLFSDVASLTSETALSGAWDSEDVMESEIVDGVVGEDQTEVDAREDDLKAQLVATEDVTEIVNATAEEEIPQTSGEEAHIAEDLPIPLDMISELEPHQLPADEEPSTSIEPSSEDTETEEISKEEVAFNNIPADFDAELGQLEVTPSSESLTEFPVQETDEGIILSSIVSIEDPEVGHVILHEEDPQSQEDSVSYDSPTSIVEEVALLKEESAKGLVDEAQLLEEESSKGLVEEVVSLEEDSAEGLYSPFTSIGLVVAAMAVVVALLLKLLKRTPKTVTLATAIQAETAAERKNAFPAAELKSMSSPVARSVYSSHILDRVELDAISSPFRTQRNFSLRAAEPALSAPGLRARVEPAKPATTWHPAMRAGSNTISSSGYRQTASYVPTFPTESSISTSTRGASDTDSVCESALTMGADEWEHLGSFTTTELVSVNEGGEDHKIRTPVRRSQRIRNRVSPLPLKFT